MKNSVHNVVEPTTGAIVYNITELKLNGKVIDQRGIYYYNASSAASQVTYPVIKEVNPAGYVRDIQMGNSISDCPHYKVSAVLVTLKAFCGDKVFITKNYPVALLEHETLPTINWAVSTPSLIEMRLEPIAKD